MMDRRDDPIATFRTFVAGLKLHWQIPVLAAYATWVLYVGHFHESWFDEAQAWLLARDSSLWQLFAERVRYEGTPGLWHAILWLAIRCDLPYPDLHLISASFAIAGAAVILWRSPFAPMLRVAILCSYFFAYQFPVVARSYCIDLLLVPLAAAWFATRVDRPVRYAVVVGVMANLNTHSFLAAALLGLELVWQFVRARRLFHASALTGMATAGLLGCFALATAWQPADNGFMVNLPSWQEQLTNFVSNAFIDRGMLMASRAPTQFDRMAGFIASALIVVPFVRLVRRGEHFVLIFAIALALIAFSASTYSNAWHSGLLLLFTIFGLWISWPTDPSMRLRKHATAALAIICGCQGVQAMRTGVWDVHHYYSSGRPVAHAVQSYRASHPHATVAVFGYNVFEAQPYAPVNLFDNYHRGAPHPSYVIWTTSEPWSPGEHSEQWQQTIDTHADLLLASLSRVDGDTVQLMPQACLAGYGLKRVFHAEIRWRGAWWQDESTAIFLKGSRDGCDGTDRRQIAR